MLLLNLIKYLNSRVFLSDKFKVINLKMVKGISSMNKTERIINLLLVLSNAKNRTLHYEQIIPLLGNAYATQHKVLNELLEGSAGLPPILVKIGDGDKKYCSYKLNSAVWENFAFATNEGRFYFEAFKNIGRLFDNEYLDADYADSEEFDQSKITGLPRKFIYLSQVQANPYSDELKQVVDDIINALVSDKMIEIFYRTGFETEFDNASWRKVKPLTLCQYRDDLYLLCHKIENNKWVERNYKICRIEQTKVLEDKFTYPCLLEWNPQEKYKITSGLMLEHPPKQCIIRVYGNSRQHFEEKSFFNCQRLARTESYNDYALLYTSIQEFVGQLFVYAQDVAIVEGDEIREEKM